MGEQPWPGSPMWNAAVDKVGEVLADGVESRVAATEARLAQAEAKLAEIKARRDEFHQALWDGEWKLTGSTLTFDRLIQAIDRAALLDQEDSGLSEGSGRSFPGKGGGLKGEHPASATDPLAESDPETRKEGSDG